MSVGTGGQSPLPTLPTLPSSPPLPPPHPFLSPPRTAKASPLFPTQPAGNNINHLPFPATPPCQREIDNDSQTFPARALVGENPVAAQATRRTLSSKEKKGIFHHAVGDLDTRGLALVPAATAAFALVCRPPGVLLAVSQRLLLPGSWR